MPIQYLAFSRAPTMCGFVRCSHCISLTPFHDPSEDPESCAMCHSLRKPVASSTGFNLFKMTITWSDIADSRGLMNFVPNNWHCGICQDSRCIISDCHTLPGRWERLISKYVYVIIDLSVWWYVFKQCLLAQVLLIHTNRHELFSSEAMSRTLVFGGRGFVGAVSLLQRGCLYLGEPSGTPQVPVKPLKPWSSLWSFCKQ